MRAVPPDHMETRKLEVAVLGHCDEAEHPVVRIMTVICLRALTTHFPRRAGSIFILSLMKGNRGNEQGRWLAPSSPPPINSQLVKHISV